MKLAEILALVLREYKITEKRSLPHTESRVRTITKHLDPHLDASQLDAVAIQQYIERRRSAGAANATINRELALIRRGLCLVRAPIPHIPALRESNPRRGFFTPEEIEDLLWMLEPCYRLPTEFAYHTGWRRGEILCLRWDINVDDDSVFLLPDQTKSGDSRSIPLDSFAAVRRVVDRAREKRDPRCPYLFHREGKKIAPVTLTKAFGRAAERAGLRGKIFHDLRRTAVRNLVRAGIPPFAAKRITGHKTDSVFERYNIVTEQDIRRLLGQSKIGR